MINSTASALAASSVNADYLVPALEATPVLGALSAGGCPVLCFLGDPGFPPHNRPWDSTWGGYAFWKQHPDWRFKAIYAAGMNPDSVAYNHGG